MRRGAHAPLQFRTDRRRFPYDEVFTAGARTERARAGVEARRVKVLFVSDSLGSPIEQRGIHNFSVSLIENLRGQGGEVALLVERSPGRWMAGRMRSKVVNIDETKKSVALAEVLRFFAEKRYKLDWVHQWSDGRLPGFVKKLGAWAYIGFVRIFAGKTVTVENTAEAVDFVPTNASHLALPSRFVVTPAVYSEMMLRRTE